MAAWLKAITYSTKYSLYKPKMIKTQPWTVTNKEKQWSQAEYQFAWVNTFATFMVKYT